MYTNIEIYIINILNNYFKYLKNGKQTKSKQMRRNDNGKSSNQIENGQ